MLSAPAAPATPYQRTLAAAELLADEFGIADQVARLREAGCWQDQASATIAECLAGLALDTRAARGRLRR